MLVTAASTSSLAGGGGKHPSGVTCDDYPDSHGDDNHRPPYEDYSSAAACEGLCMRLSRSLAVVVHIACWMYMYRTW
jgi:hypothetical protein